ncbi:MAG: HXXEE domain-containing protein, partial [Chromatiaceae bacterium]|nr:HXXEE domain-containing protein [Chromatiaceae bacterium]
LLAGVAPWLGFAMIWFELVINNATHNILFQGDKPAYNPGLLTNSFLLLPYGMVTLLVATEFFTPLDWVLSLVIGIGVAALLGLKTRRRLASRKPSPV